MLVDLRSDTVTRPDAAMRAAMLAAEVGDDVFAEDPTVNALQERCAAMLGHEAALFCPSGTMTNQIAIQVHTQPGDEVICDHLAHIYNYEGGGIARNSGASVKLVQGDRGRFNLSHVIQGMNPLDSHYARTSLVAVEDTCNKGGGSVWDLDQLAQLSSHCRDAGLRFHLDGARAWNGWVARGMWGDHECLVSYGRMFDSVSLCFSKGMGCPVGSILVGSDAFIREAHRSRKVLGGGMRQAGMLAAAALHAMDNHVNDLTHDHHHAQMLESVLKEHPEVSSVDPVESNIVIFTLASLSADAAVRAFADMGIACFAFGPHKIRLVTHRDVRADSIEEACLRLASWNSKASH